MATPTPMPQLSQAFLEESRQANLYAATIIPFVFAVFAVAARFWCRWNQRSGYGLDDGLIAISLLFLIGLTVASIFLTRNGLGRHLAAVGLGVSRNFWLGVFIAEITYTGVIIFVKYSILALYWRLFGSLIKWQVVVFTIIISLWGLGVYITEFLSCQPLHKYWDHEAEGVCNVNVSAFFLVIIIPNLLTDIVLLVLPIRYVVKLNLVSSAKRALVVVFLLGGFVCIASILRLVSLINPDLQGPDPTWAFRNQSIWSVVECNAAVVSACLPTLRPLWNKIRSSMGSISKNASKQQAGYRVTDERPKKSSRNVRGLFSISALVTRGDDLDAEEGRDHSLRALNDSEQQIKVVNGWSVRTESFEGDKASHQESIQMK